MIRPVAQRDGYSCGPVAILNALKWAGIPVTEKRHLNIIRDLTDADVGRGVWPWDLDDALMIVPGVRVKKRIESPRLAVLDKHIDGGGAAVVLYLFRDKKEIEGHYTLCIGRTKKYYIVVNDKEDGGTITRMARKTMYRGLTLVDKIAGANHYGTIWLIEPTFEETRDTRSIRKMLANIIAMF